MKEREEKNKEIQSQIDLKVVPHQHIQELEQKEVFSELHRELDEKQRLEEENLHLLNTIEHSKKIIDSKLKEKIILAESI